VSSFTEGVHYYHDHIISVRLREFNYEVDTYGVPADVRHRKRFEVAGWRLPQNLCAEAEIASSSVLTDVPQHIRPPVIPRNQLESFPPTGVSSNVTIMVKRYYLPSNVGSGNRLLHRIL
jgi:hypothetical protein